MLISQAGDSAFSEAITPPQDTATLNSTITLTPETACPQHDTIVDMPVESLVSATPSWYEPPVDMAMVVPVAPSQHNAGVEMPVVSQVTAMSTDITPTEMHTLSEVAGTLQGVSLH